VHDHGDEKYAQYSNELWPNNPNFTLAFLLCVLRTLEATAILESKLLFKHPPHNSFFACMLQGKSCCIRELCTLDQIVGSKPLLINLLFQMDNCVKDNKN
jgi:hypothetical protein